MPEDDCWILNEESVISIKKNEILIKVKYLSIDPYMRGRMNDGMSYASPTKIGQPMVGETVGTIIDRNSHHYTVGDTVCILKFWQTYIKAKDTDLSIYKIPNANIPLSAYLGVAGMPGRTAYFGFNRVGKPIKEDVVVVSAASGAVGSVVGQLAKIKGCTVIGIAGGKDKCDYLLNDLGFVAAIVFKSENIYEALKEKCPKGVDVYFDNVGGEILNAALTKLRMHARIVICGAISQYNNKIAVKGPSNYLSLLVNRATMQGMVVMDYAKDYKKAAQEMGMWIAQGKLKSKEDVYNGIENFQETFARLFNGDKKGKLVLKVIED